METARRHRQRKGDEMVLTEQERNQIADILNRRANEVAIFLGEYRSDKQHFGSVELALTREIERLRRLADKVNPQECDE